MKDIKKILALNIKRLRKECGYSQEKLAELSSLHRTYIGSIEREERNVSIENIQAIAKAFQIDTYLLLKDNK